MADVTLFAEKVVQVGPLPITNSMIITWLVSIMLISVSFMATRRMALVPSGLQNIVETMVEGLHSLVENAAGNRTKLFFPLVATFFFYILFNNWFGLLPGVGTIGFYETEHHETVAVEQTSEHLMPTTMPELTPEESKKIVPLGHETGETQSHEVPSGEEMKSEALTPDPMPHTPGVFVPFFRAGSSDLNFTLALALISIISCQYFGIVRKGFFGYVTHYFHNPVTGSIAMVAIGLVIGIFIGAIEVISEFIKIVSLSVRLFGNIYAGEALLNAMSNLAPFIVPLPFLLLEVMVGFVQATVFSMLSAVFLSIITDTHGHDDHEQHSGSHVAVQHT